MADTLAAVVLSAGTAALAGHHAWTGHQRRQRLAQLTTRRLARDVTGELTALAQRTEVLAERIRTARAALRPELPGAREAAVGLDLLEEFHSLLLTELQRWAEKATRETGPLRGLAARRADLLALRAQIRQAQDDLDRRQTAWGGASDAKAEEPSVRTIVSARRPTALMPPATQRPAPRPTLAWTRG